MTVGKLLKKCVKSYECIIYAPNGQTILYNGCVAGLSKEIKQMKIDHYYMSGNAIVINFKKEKNKEVKVKDLISRLRIHENVRFVCDYEGHSEFTYYNKEKIPKELLNSNVNEYYVEEDILNICADERI